ncbi:CAP domain-containing protein [Paraconexibacter sp.]|uniref:CAP domain-containing protein n=1 Tax=Paraconexibacter sp. TaxID=2949640 RepID=UPI00356A5778
MLLCALTALLLTLPTAPAHAGDQASAASKTSATKGTSKKQSTKKSKSKRSSSKKTKRGSRSRSSRSSAGCVDANLTPTAHNLERVRRATLCLLNRERTKRGRVKLRAHPTLRKVARSYASTMVKQRFFGHVSPSGSTMLRRVRSSSYLRGSLRRWELGENLGWATGGQATPSAMVKAWMRSTGHRRNILERSYREIGIGIVRGAPKDVDGGVTYVTEFGLRVRR